MPHLASRPRAGLARSAVRLTGALFVSLVLTASLPAVSTARQGPDSLADLAEGLLDAVVNISTSQTVDSSRSIPMPEVPEGSPFKDFFDEFFDKQRRGERPRKVQSLGSGFVIDSAGIIITNNHVIADADEITANFSDGSKLEADVIGRDTKTDIAVLRVKTNKHLKAVKLGNSDVLRVGDWVMAIGNPFGLGGSVSVGIVSARNRNINAGPYDNFIQTDAAINRGNSGGPLFNLDGEVVGINTAIFSPTGGSIGIGFAVPSSTAAPVIEQLIKFGETRRGWLGVRIQEVTDEIAESLGMDTARGALIAGINQDGPAAGTGLEAGDVVVGFDGKPIGEMRDLPRIVADTAPDKDVDVVVVRNGKEMTFKVKIGRLEEVEKTAEVAPEDKAGDVAKPANVLGMELSPLTDELRKQYKIDEKVEGVIVTAVEQDGAAAERGIAPGAVIVEVAQEQVRAPADIVTRVENLKQQDRRSVLLLLSDAGGELRFVAVRIKE